MKNNNEGEPILDEKDFSFSKNVPIEVYSLIDTASVYVEVPSKFDLKNNYLDVLIFHNDGFYEKTSNQHFRKFQRGKYSVFYGGMYRMENGKLYFESFYPSDGGKTSKFVKEFSEGYIDKDTIHMNFFGTKRLYVKKPIESMY